MMESQIAVIFPCACSLPVTFPTARVLHLHTAVPAASSFFDVSCVLFHTPLFLKKRFCVFIFRERGRGGKKCGCLSHAQYWRTWPATQACAWTGNWTGNPLVHSLCLIHWATPARGPLPVFLREETAYLYLFLPPCTVSDSWWSSLKECINERTNEPMRHSIYKVATKRISEFSKFEARKEV